MDGLARPQVGPRLAEDIARRLYGLDAAAEELGSNQDRNFLLETPGGGYVLKVDNAVFEAAELEAQSSAIEHLHAAGVPAARVLPGLDGRLLQRATDLGGTGHHVRLFERAAGASLVGAGHLAPPVLADVGELAGRVSAALAGFRDPGLDRTLQWDLRRAASVVRDLLPYVVDQDRAEQVRSAAERATELLAPWAPELPVQALHGDLTDDNILATPGPAGRPRIGAVIDFGDLALGWRVAEPAVTCASLLHHVAGDPLRVLSAVRAFHARSPLAPAEARAFWPLLVLRAAVLVVSGWRQTDLEPGNEYAVERMDHEWTIFEMATSLPSEVATEAVLDALQFTQATPDTAFPADATFPTNAQRDMRQAAYARVVDRPGGAPGWHVLDLGIESPLLDAGLWLETGTEDLLVRQALAAHGTAVLPHGVPRLTRSRTDAADEPDTVPLVLEVHAVESFDLVSPWAADVVRAGDDALELAAADGWRLRLSGVETALRRGDRIAAGAKAASYPGRPMGSGPAASRPRKATDPASYSGGPLLAQLLAPGAPDVVPCLSRPALWPAWRRLTADPAHLFGLPAAAPPGPPEREQARRERLLPSAQERYYARPPQIERGWRHHLVDTTGRAYLDLVNNVTGLGHGHPAVAAAAARQLALLNTNSRFLYRVLAEYGERLAALAPDGSGLDTVLLVNSGSEAVDLALRLARAATGRPTVVALREAYHGWTFGADAVTTSGYDNPHALATRPGWVHVADVPNPLRGTHTGAEAGERYAEDLAADLQRLVATGRPPAAFICESVLGNAGGVLLPEGYLRQVYAAVRAAGGLCIADEIQVGFGRMGAGFWGFALQDVVPDIVTIAKPMGNGFPIGAVLTTRAIAESLATEGMFFSSAGGSPVACAVGLAVLDAMEAEDLAGNARDVGSHLKDRLEELGERHPRVAHVHGAGLYLGVELVRDRATLEPAAEETAAICERLLELGVVVQPTSERQNVLKIKPPLCLTRESADFAVAMIDRVLSEGW